MKVINKEDVRKHLLYFIKNPFYSIPVLITTICSYIFFCSHLSIGIDDLTAPRYMSGELIAQGRFTGQIIDFFMPFDSVEILYNTIGIFFYVLATLLFCILFKIVCNDRNISIVPFTFFSCLFISYPLVVEIFGYHGLPFAIGGNMLLISIVLIILYSKVKHKFLLTSILLAFSCAWHEGEIPVYICATFALLLLELYNQQNQTASIKFSIKRGIYFARPLLCGLILKIILSKMLLIIFSLEKSTESKNYILYFEQGLLSCFQQMWQTIKYEFILKMGVYLPIFVLAISVIISWIIGIIMAIKTKKIVFFLLIAGMNISLFLLSLIQGQITPFRASQVFTFFVAFILFLLVYFTINKKILSKLICTICVLIIINQVIDINKWFEVDYQRSQMEAGVVQNIGFELTQNYDLNKPVVFTGYYDLSNNIKDKMYISSDNWWVQFLNKLVPIYDLTSDTPYWKKIHQNLGASVISWGIYAFDEVNTELLRVFSYYGYDLLQGTPEMYAEAQNIKFNNTNHINIIETEKYILVHFQ